MIRRTCLVALLVFVAARLAPAADDKKPTADEIDKARKIVDKRLAEVKAPAGRVGGLVSITDEPLGKALPGQVFFLLRYPQYPVGIMPPEPLRVNNIFAVSKDGKLEHLTDIKALEKFFQTTLAPVKEEEALKDVCRSWLRLGQEIHNDGMFRFKEDAIKVEAQDTGKKVTGKVLAMAGGNGDIAGTLSFDKDGKLTSAATTPNLKQGIRPICQSTKLLDADPIVRRMAEQDILVMGKACQDYLLEQRAQASPELQAAIDRIWQRILDEDR